MRLRFSEDFRLEEHFNIKKEDLSHFRVHSKCTLRDLTETKTWQPPTCRSECLAEPQKCVFRRSKRWFLLPMRVGRRRSLQAWQPPPLQVSTGSSAAIQSKRTAGEVRVFKRHDRFSVRHHFFYIIIMIQAHSF